MFVFGLVGLVLSNLQFPASPFLLGVILGSMTDSNLRRGLKLSDGSIAPMFSSAICIIFLIVILCMILSQMGLFKAIKKAVKKEKN